MNIDHILQAFHFLRPWWLLLLPLLLLMLWYLRRRRLQSRSWQAVCDTELLPHLLIREDGASARRGVLWLVGLTGLLAITALAGPAWQQIEQPVFRDQSALVVMLDLSRSMDATDIRPTRLTRARLKLIDILKRRKEGQSALIVYAADAFVVSPLTEDAETIIAQVSSLKTSLMPQQGSRPDLAIDRAQQLLVQAGALRGDLLLISDGIENVPLDALRDSVDTLKQAGYRLSVLGVGDAEGAPIALPDGGFLKDKTGAIVIPRLDEAALRELAQQGGGRYQSMTIDDRDIATLLIDDLSEHKLTLEAAQGFKADQWREEGPWLLLLLLPLVLVAFRRGYLLLASVVIVPLVFFPVSPVSAAEASQSWWDNLWSTPDQRAARAFKNEEMAQAAKLFNDKAWQAAAHYRSGNYQQSIEALEGLDNAEALYNKGNAYARMQQWQAALDAYDQALIKRPDHEDAKHNRALVQQQLQQLSDDTQSEAESSEPSGGDGEQASQRESEGAQAESQPESQQDGAQQGASQSAASEGAQSGRPPSDLSQSGDDASEQSEAMSQPSQAEQGESQNALQQRAEQRHDEAAEAAEQRDNMAQSQEGAEASQTDGPTAMAPSEFSEAQTAIQQANDQWLRRIPDDPGGLLRRKFQYQSQRAKNRSGGQPQVEDESW